MRLYTQLAGIACSVFVLIIVLGCAKSDPSVTTPVARPGNPDSSGVRGGATAIVPTAESPANGEGPPIRTPDVETAAPKPAWASSFLTAVHLLGKPKDDIVAAFGAPDSAGGTRYDYDRKFQSDKFAMFLYFRATDKKLELVNMNLEDKPSAGSTWEALSGTRNKPQYYQIVDSLMENYWKGRDDDKNPGDAGMLMSVNGQVEGQVIQLNASIAEPPMKAVRVFDTKTDGFVVGKLQPNSDSTWRDARVFQIQSGVHDTCNTGLGPAFLGEPHFLESLSGPPSTLVGSWTGIFENVKAELNIQRQDPEGFSAILTRDGDGGAYRVQIRGSLIGQTGVKFKETKVLPGLRGWILGTDTGSFGDSGSSMIGKGTAGRSSYSWSFTKRDSVRE